MNLNRSSTSNSFTSNQKKREKELEDKIKDDEQIIQDGKKQIKRLTEMNQQFLAKIKELEMSVYETSQCQE